MVNYGVVRRNVVWGEGKERIAGPPLQSSQLATGPLAQAEPQRPEDPQTSCCDPMAPPRCWTSGLRPKEERPKGLEEELSIFMLSGPSKNLHARKVVSSTALPRGRIGRSPTIGVVGSPFRLLGLREAGPARSAIRRGDSGGFHSALRGPAPRTAGCLFAAGALRFLRITIDQVMPAYQFHEFHSIRVRAPPARVFRAFWRVTPGDIRFFNTLMAIRSLPKAAGRWHAATVCGPGLRNRFLRPQPRRHARVTCRQRHDAVHRGLKDFHRLRGQTGWSAGRGKCHFRRL